MLIYMMNSGSLPNIDEMNQKKSQFKLIKNAKTNHTMADLCAGPTKDLKDFIFEVFSYTFTDEPKYEKLRSMLSELIKTEEQAQVGRRAADKSGKFLQLDTQSDNKLFQNCDLSTVHETDSIDEQEDYVEAIEESM